MVCLPHDDVERDRYTLMSLPYFSAGKPPRLALEEVMMHTMWRYRRDRVSLSGEWRKAQRELGYVEYETLALLLRDGEGALASRGQEPAGPPPRTKIGGAEVFFEILPSMAAGVYGKPDEVEVEVVEKLRKVLDSNGIVSHYPVGYFAGKGKEQDLYHDGVHLHWQGHALYADYLVERVTKDSARYKSFIAGRAP